MPWQQLPQIHRAANALVDHMEATERGPQVLKWPQYLPPYARHLAHLRGGRPKVRVLEIGINSGGSIFLWREFFGAERLEYVGIDVNPYAKYWNRYETEGRIRFVLGDGNNRTWLEGFAAESNSPFDVIIDDGSHDVVGQRAALAALWPILRPGGVFAVEDIHSSYIKEHGGGPGNPGNMVARAAELIDELHAWRGRDQTSRTSALMPVTEYSRTLYGLHVYESLLLLEKRVCELREEDGLYGGLVNEKAGDLIVPFGM